MSQKYSRPSSSFSNTTPPLFLSLCRFLLVLGDVGDGRDPLDGGFEGGATDERGHHLSPDAGLIHLPGAAVATPTPQPHRNLHRLSLAAGPKPRSLAGPRLHLGILFSRFGYDDAGGGWWGATTPLGGYTYVGVRAWLLGGMLSRDCCI